MGQLSSKLRHGALDGVKILSFWCPGCKQAHSVSVDGNGTWGWNGSVDKPTFSPSVLVTYQHPKGHSNDNPAPVDWVGEYVNDICHSFVTDGRIQFLADCTHDMAGQTVNLPNWRPDESL